MSKSCETTTSAANNRYKYAYFYHRRRKEVRRVSLFGLGLIAGLLIAIFGTMTTIQFLGLAINLLACVGIVTWLIDGKDYVLPYKACLKQAQLSQTQKNKETK